MQLTNSDGGRFHANEEAAVVGLRGLGNPRRDSRSVGAVSKTCDSTTAALSADAVESLVALE